MRARALLALALVLGALLLAAALVALQSILALAPLEIVLDGHQELVGVAVADGTLYVSDRGAGVVYRRKLEPPGQPTEAVAGLDRPAGLAVDRDGRLLIAEEKAGRVLRLEPDGTLSVLATGIKKPRWLAVSPDGAIYVSAHRRQPPGRADETEGREILRLVPGKSLTIVASGIRRLEGLARLSSAIVAATRGLESGPESAGMLLWYPVLDDGSLGAPLTWVDTGLKQPMGLVLDWLGALYVSSKELAVGIDTAKRAVGKVHPDARLSTFAEHFEDPQGVALGPEGSLYVADGNAGRLLHFQAPPAPALNPLPAFTNQSPLSVGGATGPTLRVDLFLDDAATAVTGTADASGAFALTVALTPNAKNTLQVFATTHGGDGLTGPPARANLTHDNTPPAVAFLNPAATSRLSGIMPVEIAASDSLSGIAAVQLLLDGPLQGSRSAPPFTFSLDTARFAPGWHTLTARAFDQAGNSAAVSITVEVSRLRVTITAPADGATVTTDTLLVRGTVEAGGAEVGVTVNGTLALVTSPQWATTIRLGQGSNAISAIATTATGDQATASITVQAVQPQEAGVVLRASPVSGLAPLTVRFEVASALARPIVRYELDHNGDGIPDLRSPTFENVQVTYTQPGIITPLLTVTDDQGRAVTATTTIQVLDPAATIALLQVKWGALKAALTQGNIEGALQAVAVGIRTRYRPALQALRGDLPALAATLGDLQVISFQDGLAEAATVRLEDGQRRVYFIYFAPDDDGIWRILGM